VNTDFDHFYRHGTGLRNLWLEKRAIKSKAFLPLRQ
jgi:hypothetical protein